MKSFDEAALGDNGECDQEHADLIQGLFTILNAVSVCLIMSHDKHNGAYSLSTTITEDLYETAMSLVPHAKKAYSDIIPSYILSGLPDEKLWPLALAPALCQIGGYEHDGKIPGHEVRIFDAGVLFPEDRRADRAEFAALVNVYLVPFISEGSKKLQKIIGCARDLDPELLPEALTIARDGDMLDEPFEEWFAEALSAAMDNIYHYGSVPEQVHRHPDEIGAGEDYKLLYN